MVSTQGLAAASARHPWRTIGAWAVAALLAMVAIGALLGGSLTTEGRPTNDPQSFRAEDVRAEAFPSSETSAITDVVVVRSTRHTTDEPEFQRFVAGLTDSSTTLGAAIVTPAPTISEDGRALLVGAAFGSDEDTGEAIGEVVAADADPDFAVAIAGDETLQHDFNLLSQEDLEKGEIQFGLPAALIILLLVFGTVVAGVVPLLMAIVSIVVALGLVALVAQAFTLSVFVVNMLTGMGLALGIDYSLFVVSRYREERGRGREKLDAIAASGATASRAVLFSGAAFIIIAVFAGFARGDLVAFQQMGFGVAVALLLDATIIRSVLLPSAMKLLGDWNWYLPRWLDWIPELHIEGPPRGADAAPGASEV